MTTRARIAPKRTLFQAKGTAIRSATESFRPAEANAAMLTVGDAEGGGATDREQ